MFAWIFCITIVAVSGQFVFEQSNANLRNLVINNNTGEVFVGGENFIYKLNQNLGKLDEVYTPCILGECGKPGQTVESNINQLLMVENLTGAPRLFGCGTYGSTGGACVTYDMTSLSQHTLLEDTVGAVSTNASYTSVALQDPQNKGILIASTRIQNGPSDYSANLYETIRCRGTLRPCIGMKAVLKLLGNRPKIYYILAVIVGNFRYFFSFSKDGSSVARLCESYKHIASINTYMEMPLRCVGKDGTNFGKLVAAKVVRPDGKLAEKFGSTGNYADAVFVGVFQKSSVSSQSAVCTYTFKQINEFFWKNIEKCFSVKPPEIVIRNKYLEINRQKCVYDRRITTCPDEIAKNQRMIGTIKYESQALVTCSACGFISSMDATIYRGNIVAFLGAKTGKLIKVLMSSNSSGQIYEITSSGIPESIISLNFDSNVTSVYLLTRQKVIKVPVNDCSKVAKCDVEKEVNVRALGTNCTFHVKCTTPIMYVPETTTRPYVQKTTQSFINATTHVKVTSQITFIPGTTISSIFKITTPSSEKLATHSISTIMAFGIGAGTSALIFGILIFLIWYFSICKVRPRKEKSRKDNASDNNIEDEIKMDEIPEKIYVLPMASNSETNQWEIRRENIKIEKIIGQGSFGKVAKGILKDSNQLTCRIDQTVAIKMVKEDGTDDEKEALLSELNIMKRLAKHPNVINLLGCVTLTDPPLVLITFVPNGDLLGYLKKSRGQLDNYFNDLDMKPDITVTSTQLMRFAKDIACGMAFLALNKVVHRDLAARNVLLDEHLICKITDFGMARNVKYTDEVYTRTSRVRIPVKWTAVESLMYNTCTTHSDVWSYGIVLYEIFTIGGKPYPGVKISRVYALLKDGYRMSKPIHVDNELFSIMLQCWDSNPEERPSFSALEKIMSTMEKEHEVYVNISLYDSSLYEDMD